MNKVKSRKKNVAVILEGIAGIDNAHDIKDKLLKAVNNNQTVAINVEKVESSDIAVLQLMYAMMQHCVQVNKSFTIHAGANQIFKNLLVNSGYEEYFQLK
ncbi:MAG TPA: STAS domain-containing protein [bacterium]|nr:STAS domain-containing protein [bacterium]HPN43959.1 STAS domain-containing protein [bacterium]